MSEHDLPTTYGRLLDGREFRVEADGAHIGDRVHLLELIQEARLLFLRPETIGLRMSDVGLAEYSFARPGDGVAALEAIYQRKPELRRADAPAPSPEAPPHYFAPIAPPPTADVAPTPGPIPMANVSPNAAPYGPYGPYGPSGRVPYSPPLPAGPIPFPQTTLEAFGPRPNATHAELTPAPRGAGQLIGSAFRLYGKRFGPLLSLTLLAATAPMALIALADVALTAMGGDNPLAGTPNPLDTMRQALSGHPAPTPTATATTPLDTVIGLAGLALAVMSLIVFGWSSAALALGARQAVLGRAIDVRACLREGWTRAWPTLMSLLVVAVLLGIVAVPGLGLALSLALAPNVPASGMRFTPADTTAFYVAAAFIAALTLASLSYLWTRFALYPTATALGLPNPLRRTLALTTFGWFRVFWALLVVTVVTSLLTISADAAQLYSVALSAVILAPLAQMLAGPLGALIRVGALYDQRLRREGYALFQQESVTPPAEPSVAHSEQG